MRRLTARIAVAGALAAVPPAALAIPASAASADSGIPVVSQISDPEWNHDHGGDNQDHHNADQDRHDRPGDQDHGPDQPQPQPAPQNKPQPPSGSLG